MRASINDPEAHRPHGPSFGFGYTDVGEPGAYVYQPPNSQQIKLAETLAEKAQSPDDFDLAIDDFQAWCELNWKAPHGTAKSSERLMAKLIEESAELEEALYHGSVDDILSEAGDVLWCTTTLASDLKVNVKHGLANLLTAYGHGTRYYEDGTVPPWVTEARGLAFNTNLSLSDIDKLIDKGYKPQPSPVMNIDNDNVKQIDIYEAATDTKMASLQLNSIARMNYGPDIYQSGEAYNGEVAEQLAAMIYLQVAFVVRHAARFSIAETSRMNILKLSGRVDTGTIDKSDGPRSKDEGSTE